MPYTLKIPKMGRTGWREAGGGNGPEGGKTVMKLKWEGLAWLGAWTVPGDRQAGRRQRTAVHRLVDTLWEYRDFWVFVN